MRLRNKKTGGIIEIYLVGDTLRFKRLDKKTESFDFNSLKDLTEEWEDYEEPKSMIKDVWFNSTLADGHFVEIDFISDEEAEKAVEKLKAWKRLKDAGVVFKGWGWEANLGNYAVLGTKDTDCLPDEIELNRRKDLDLLFGGKNE